MMSCPLPLPLPLLPPALHVDFPPVHIGVKRRKIHVTTYFRPSPIFCPPFLQPSSAAAVAAAATTTASVGIGANPSTVGAPQPRPLQPPPSLTATTLPPQPIALHPTPQQQHHHHHHHHQQHLLNLPHPNQNTPLAAASAASASLYHHHQSSTVAISPPATPTTTFYAATTSASQELGQTAEFASGLCCTQQLCFCGHCYQAQPQGIFLSPPAAPVAPSPGQNYTPSQQQHQLVVGHYTDFQAQYSLQSGTNATTTSNNSSSSSSAAEPSSSGVSSELSYYATTTTTNPFAAYPSPHQQHHPLLVPQQYQALAHQQQYQLTQQHYQQQLLNHQFQQQQYENSRHSSNSASSISSNFSKTLSMRGSDELLSQAAVMAPASDNNNQDLATKKAKLDSTNTVIGMGITKTSRVVHIRNIPNEVSEVEIMQLGMPFGRVTNVLVLKGKNQAFIEMMDENAASQMVTAFHATPPFLRGRTVYVQYSNHRELKIDQNHAIANVTNALQAQDLTQSPTGSPLPLAIDHTNSNSHSASTNNTNNSTTTPSSGGGGGGGGGAPNTVLRVIVESLLYPVSLDVLHQIFQRFGKVLKIVTFTKNNSFQALIQYPDAQTAQAAKQSLDGQNIYNGCCTLRIDNSKLTALNVKYNNDKSRDYTNPSLPSGEPGSDVIASAGGLVSASDLLLLAAGQRPQLARDRLVNGLATPGVMPPFGLGIGTPALASAYGGALPSLNAFALASNGALGTPNPANVRGLSNVLLVSNLNDEMVTPDALFTLFGVYGDVQRVKILYNKKDSALIQMAEPYQAYLAMTHLDKLRIWNKTIRVMPSKHQAVQLPKEGQPDAGLTRDYAQNPLHRFKKPGSKNYQNIYPPSATLHLSNIPATVTEDEIKEAFTKNSFEVKAFKFFPKDHKMALIQLSSIEEAVCALIKMHNYQLSESNHLRVSFSKSNI